MLLSNLVEFVCSGFAFPGSITPTTPFRYWYSGSDGIAGVSRVVGCEVLLLVSGFARPYHIIWLGHLGDGSRFRVCCSAHDLRVDGH